MRRALALHPDSRCEAVSRIDVEVARLRSGTMALGYIVTGRIAGLRLPPVTEPTRTDELWRRTCFEAFVRTAADTAYYEFNLSPSTQWAAYGFAGYRRGIRIANEIDAPHVEMESTNECYALRASLNLDRLPGLPSDAVWQLGLSAVIEETNGNISYWALAHPQGRADFHHSDCFALELGRA
jgi:hypothetical protein